MQNRIVPIILTAIALSVPALAQGDPLPLESALEKQLASRASDVTEVTLSKSMLAFAAKILNSKHEDDAETRKLIEGLDGIYVRDYEFDKAGAFTAEDVDQLRKQFETAEWSSLVKERERKTGESTDIMVKLVNGESHGMFILDVEPKELTIVLILGPIKMEDLSKLKGIGGLSALGDVADSVKDKEKSKDKKGGDQ